MHLPQLIIDLAYILGVAAIVTFVFRRIRQPVVLGYILAGVLVGPHSPGPSVAEIESIKVWAELGVIFLMFALGLEFSFRKLMSIGFPAAITGVLQVIVMLWLGYMASIGFGWGPKTGWFLGGMIAISSTTIIIKVFDELKLRGRRFTDLVFGILIVEDLAAILILVMLSSLGSQTEMDALILLQSALQLVLVIGAWFLFGMFIVPRLMRSVSRYESDELFVLFSVALCLGLVLVAAKFDYSVALGAFMMGSILAETRDVKRIEHLIAPLKDVFGAVFFVSVGMMLDPQVIMSDWIAILAISALVLVGKILSVFGGALLAGQPIEDASRISLSMAQIGEFSFIIATLGLTLGTIEPRLYPIIVSTSLVTSFVTPYLIRASDPITRSLTSALPTRLIAGYDRYRGWLAVQMSRPNANAALYKDVARWLSCAVITIAIFGLSAQFLASWLFDLGVSHSDAVAWFMAFIASTPFIWAMIVPGRSSSKHPVPVRRRLSLVGALLAVFLIGSLSREFLFLSLTQAAAFTLAGVLLLLFFLRRQVEARYRWFERQFLAGFASDEVETNRTLQLSKALGPWDVTLQEIVVPVGSPLRAKTLMELKLREQYGINVVCIERGLDFVVTPLPEERLLPMDRLLVFGDDSDVAKFRDEQVDLKQDPSLQDDGDVLARYRTAVFVLEETHGLVGRTIRQSRLREDYECLVMGIERSGSRIKNPSSDLELAAGDVLWIVGPAQKLNILHDWKVKSA